MHMHDCFHDKLEFSYKQQAGSEAQYAIQNKGPLLAIRLAFKKVAWVNSRGSAIIPLYDLKIKRNLNWCK